MTCPCFKGLAHYKEAYQILYDRNGVTTTFQAFIIHESLMFIVFSSVVSVRAQYFKVGEKLHFSCSCLLMFNTLYWLCGYV